MIIFVLFIFVSGFRKRIESFIHTMDSVNESEIDIDDDDEDEETHQVIMLWYYNYKIRDLWLQSLYKYLVSRTRLFLENKIIIKQIIIGCGYSGRGYKTKTVWWNAYKSSVSCAPKRILLLFMIFITRSHSFIDHEWNNCFCPCRLRWPHVMNIMNSNSICFGAQLTNDL